MCHPLIYSSVNRHDHPPLRLTQNKMMKEDYDASYENCGNEKRDATVTNGLTLIFVGESFSSPPFPPIKTSHSVGCMDRDE